MRRKPGNEKLLLVVIRIKRDIRVVVVCEKEGKN